MCDSGVKVEFYTCILFLMPGGTVINVLFFNGRCPNECTAVAFAFIKLKYRFHSSSTHRKTSTASVY